jgi:hypothetical protein
MFDKIPENLWFGQFNSWDKKRVSRGKADFGKLSTFISIIIYNIQIPSQPISHISNIINQIPNQIQSNLPQE